MSLKVFNPNIDYHASYQRLSHTLWMVPGNGEWAFPRSYWSTCSHGEMDFWTLSGMHKVPHVCLWCSRGNSFLCLMILHFFIIIFREVLQVMAVTRSNICKGGMESLSRGSAIIYYASVFLYFWVLSTPVVSLVFGSYLYICVNWLRLHFDEAFSSLRIANYKAFTRFHITTSGDLEVFTLAVDKVIPSFIHHITA